MKYNYLFFEFIRNLEFSSQTLMRSYIFKILYDLLLFNQLHLTFLISETISLGTELSINELNCYFFS